MITGHINSKLEAIIALTILAKDGETKEFEALVDTGYTEFITLPQSILTELNLEIFASGRLTMADGHAVDVDLFQATILWDGQPRTIEVDALESEILIGMSLLEGYDLHVHTIADGQVTINQF